MEMIEQITDYVMWAVALSFVAYLWTVVMLFVMSGIGTYSWSQFKEIKSGLKFNMYGEGKINNFKKMWLIIATFLFIRGASKKFFDENFGK